MMNLSIINLSEYSVRCASKNFQGLLEVHSFSFHTEILQSPLAQELPPNFQLALVVPQLLGETSDRERLAR